MEYVNLIPPSPGKPSIFTISETWERAKAHGVPNTLLAPTKMRYFMNTDIFLAILQAAALVVLVIQLWLAILRLKADHERQKKQATIEYIGQIWRESRYHLESQYGTDSLTIDDVSELEQNKKQLAEVVRILGQLEHVAVGVNTGVYDKEILYRMLARKIPGIFRRCSEFIKSRRKNNARAYNELEELVLYFEERNREKPPEGGEIRHS
ncbi:MAG: DUF4760 domain-containing protein [Candidatus Thiosymbion ectosymbiont of Robbea hypermnestra]|nr:DUF4760 domain-containing protein [Candidatus Thiosymbion ectosymbiont of Robbea hypermnestra]